METGFDSRAQRLGDPVICTQLYFCGGASDEQIERIIKQGFSKKGTYTVTCYCVTPRKPLRRAISCHKRLQNLSLGCCLLRRSEIVFLVFPAFGDDCMELLFSVWIFYDRPKKLLWFSFEGTLQKNFFISLYLCSLVDFHFRFHTRSVWERALLLSASLSSCCIFSGKPSFVFLFSFLLLS